MDSHGLDMKGYLKMENVSVLPTWQTSDERRVVYCEADHNLYYANDVGWVLLSGSYVLSFTNATLSSGVLTLPHSLSYKYVIVQVYDNTDKLIIPDNITLVSTDTCTVDLSSFGTLTGTWTAMVKK